MGKAWKHFRTITAHRHQVIRHCAKAGILLQGLGHDLSKYSLKEFRTGAKYWQGDHSPNAAEKAEKGYSSAWLHHKGINKHHFEYWYDYDRNTGRMEPIEMPLKYVIEMFCDRVAACKIYRGDKYTDSSAWDYYVSRKEEGALAEKTSAQLEALLKMLRDEGEEKTFAYIRTELTPRTKRRRGD